MSDGKLEVAGEKPEKKPVPIDQYMEAVREKAEDPVDQDIEKATGTILTANEAYLLSTGPEAFKQIEASIRGAKKSIKINIFSWASDSTGTQLAKVIIEAKKKNPDLKVEIRVDKLGTLLVGGKDEIKKRAEDPIVKLQLGMKLLKYKHLSLKLINRIRKDPSSIYSFSPEEKKDLEDMIGEVLTAEGLMEINPSLRALRDSGVDLIIEDNGLSRMDHSKILIFDDKTVYSGGMNVGDEYSGGFEDGKGWSEKKKDYWKDYMVLSEGPTTNLTRNHFFNESEFVPEKLFPRSVNSPLRVLYNKSGEVYENDSEFAKLKQITYATNYLLDNAKSEIQIEHAYIMDDGIIERLKAAAKRGVRITILKSSPESEVIEAQNNKYFAQLMGIPNIDIYNFPRVSHTKLLNIDGKYSIIGSANLTKASLYNHEEYSFMVSGDNHFHRQVHEQLAAAIELAKKFHEKKRLIARQTSGEMTGL